MTEEIRKRQLGYLHNEALSNLDTAISEWLIPFLNLWMNSNPQPILSTGEVEAIRVEIRKWEAAKMLPEGYEWLPNLIHILAEAKRFNQRNFINIHPSPFVPGVLASTLVALQNPNNIVEDVSGPTTRLEKEGIAWMAKNLVHFDPQQACGNVVSGGTMANLTAMLVARDYSYRKLARPRPAEV